jgi:hypothetical protein
MRVSKPFDLYFKECMSGCEYQAAWHMITEGLVREGERAEIEIAEEIALRAKQTLTVQQACPAQAIRQSGMR